MRRASIGLAALAMLAAFPAAAQPAGSEEGGVVVRRPSLMRNLVSAAKIEQAAVEQYGQLRSQASSRGSLLPPDDATAKRVQRIADALLPHTRKWNPRAKEWQWEVIVIKAPTINALCMPGGKIAVFSGILDGLKLTDDELAVVLGHEMAHALREHARARAAKVTLTNVSTLAIGLVIGGNLGELAKQGGGLLTLKFNRDDEREADLIGLELAARAGYDPQAGVTLWEKMGKAARAGPPAWLSTHPSGEDRIRRTREALKQVLPLYEKAKANLPPAQPAAN
ncbi:MAG TPA: M48 family metallopeptidase [Hyphomicrobiaceae bacterium]|nr:M48 family metallopeptidase [Hyphomicrobiaceae bacterium]